MEDKDKSHLHLVSGSLDSGIAGEFLPLPFYPYDVRPSTLPIDQDEAATALYLTGGVLEHAAARLKVEPLRLVRVINRSPRLTRLHAELVGLLNDKVHQEYLRAFASDDDRRREWAASKLSQTKQFQSHPLAPNANGSTVSLPGNASATRIIISWDDGPPPAVIDHDDVG